MRLAIVGCGKVAEKRARALGGVRLVACVDVDPERAAVVAALAAAPGARVAADWREVVHASDVDALVVSTSHDVLAPVTRAAVEAGKHVLVEKPAARRPGELDGIAELARRTGSRVRVGFNHRFHPALALAKELVEQGELGDLYYVRARYGHGGRTGYDREWRADPARSGGGELVDQGVHLIDLARWFLGDLALAHGHAPTYFWDTSVDDNAFLLLTGEHRRVAWLHASWTEWKNTFSFEVTGRHGKLEISGLGGSYGTERLTWYKMRPELGPPDVTSWEFPGEDGSWAAEMSAFEEDIASGREPTPGLADAIAALTVVERVYAGRGA